MTADAAALGPDAGLRGVRFVLASWRGIRPEWVRLTLAVGGLIALAHGMGYALSLRGTWWVIMLGVGLSTMGFAVAMLLAFAVAYHVAPGRVPRWRPFAVAAVAACVAAALVEWTVNFALAILLGEPLEVTRKELVSYALGNFVAMLVCATLVAFGCVHALEARRRADALRALQLARTRVARESYEARLRALKARVEPRFLFETLSDVEALYETAPDDAAHMLDDLILYLRTALPALDDVTTSLGAELALARTWLEIARRRARGDLVYALPDEPALAAARMPPMLLMPLVQRAVEHGAGTAGARRVVFVSAAANDGRLRIVVTGPGGAFDPGAGSAAATAVRERLRELYGTAASLSLAAVEHALSRATLEIPYESTDRGPR